MARVVSVGPRPASQRRAFGFWKTAAVGAVIAMAGVASQAHAHEGHDLPTPVVRSQVALQSLPAQLASNLVLDRSAAGRYAWASSSGQVDGHALLKHWKSKGLRAEQAIELLNVLVLTQSPVLGRTADALKHAAASSRATQDVLEVQSEQNADAFLRRNNCDSLAERGLISQVEALNRDTGDGATWKSAHQYWDAMGVQRFGEAPAAFRSEVPVEEVAAAQAQLAAAVEEAGLASLRVPVGMWGNPDVLRQLAHRLVEANATLQQLTGMEGQVLGMNGRVSFSPYSPVGNGFAYQGVDGGLRMDARWEDVPHELMHLYDSSLRSAPVDASALGGASLSHQVVDGQVATSALEKTAQSLFTGWARQGQASEWMGARATYLKGLKAGTPEEQGAAIYLGSTSEMVAYAWGSYVQSQLTQGSVFFDAQRAHREAYDGLRGPTLNQARSMKKDWEQLFGAIQASWSSSPSFASVHEWRAQRESPASPALPFEPRRPGMGLK